MVRYRTFQLRLKPASEPATDCVGTVDALYMVIVGGPLGRLVAVEKPMASSPIADIFPKFCASAGPFSQNNVFDKSTNQVSFDFQNEKICVNE